MSKDITFLSYFCSKDKDKLTGFIWNLGFKIEIKSVTYAEGKWFAWFNHSSERDPKKTKFKNIDLDQL